jgi:alpha-glucosidase (family GH31 glycosyl hydrolase)
VSHARLSVITPNCLRLEFSRSGRFVDAPSVVARCRRPSEATASSRVGETIELATAFARLRYHNDGLAFHPGNTRALIVPAGAAPITWRPGDEPEHNLGGTLRTLDGVRGEADLGHGLLARDGWFLLDDSHSPVLVDGWPAARESVTDADPDRRDWYLFAYGLDYAGALRSLAALTGPVALPPRALLGSWYSRFWAYSADEFKQIVSQYALHAFGLDVLVLDTDWHKPGWTGWSWNKDLIPDPPGLLAWLHERGLLVTLNLHPAGGVGPDEDRYADFMHALGRDPASRETVRFDPADRRYITALRDTVLAPLRADGADFWWLDWQQEPFTPSLPSLTNLRQLNAVLADHEGGTGLPPVSGPGGTGVPPASAASAERANPPRRPALLSRWAGWGDQAHPVHFSGDMHGGWASLAFQIRFTVAAGNALACFWSHDIGGHFGLRDDEAFARWVQFGAVSAALRLHSARSATLDRRPWACAPMFTGSMRRAFALRATLMPTIYTSAARCATDAVPLLRPMYLDHPTEALAYRSPDQFMLGDLLAAPISSPGTGEGRVATRHVWFPPRLALESAGGGAKGESAPVQAWYNWFTGERYQGGTEAVVAADIHEFPLFAPAGVPIVLAPPGHPMGSSRADTLVIRVYPMGPRRVAARTLYEDDGATTAHLQGRFATTTIEVATGHTHASISIHPLRGGFTGQPSERAFVIELPLLAAGTRASLNGRPIPVELAPATLDSPALGRIRVPPQPVTQRTEVGISFPGTDLARTNPHNRLRRLRGALADPIPETDVMDAVARLAREASNGPRPAVGLDTVLSIGAGLAVVRTDHAHLLIDSLGLADNGRFTFTLIDEVGSTRTEIQQQVLAAAPGVGVAIEVPPTPLGPAPLGVRATRIARLAFTIKGLPVAFDSPLRTLLTPIRQWRLAGPFPFDDRLPISAQRHAPELGDPISWRRLDLDLSTQPNAPYVTDLSRCTDPADRLYYAAATINAPRDLDATLELASADRLETWLNGEPVFSMDPGDAVDASSGSVRVSLLAGGNDLLVKVTRGGLGFAFTAALDAGEPLELGTD